MMQYLLFGFLVNRSGELCSPNPLGFFALGLLRQDRPARKPLQEQSLMKKTHQGLDNVGFIGPENIKLWLENIRGFETELSGLEDRQAE
jgi:hypothetical protein